MRRIRKVGLTVCLGAACFVFPAAASAAGGFVADEYSATATGTPVGAVVVGAGSNYNECSGQSFATSLTGPTAILAAAPKTGGTCGSGSPPEFKSCQLELHPDSNSADIGPAGCGPAKFYVQDCTMEVSAQTGLPAVYTNKGTGSSSTVEVSIATSHLKYTTSKFTLWCGAAGAHENGYLSIGWSISAKNASSQPVGLYSQATSPLPDGIFLKGGTPEGSGLARFSAQAFPVKISGARGPSESELTLLSASGFSVACKSVGVSKLSSETSNLGFDEYNECMSSLGATTVKTNSCKYSVEPTEGEEGKAKYSGRAAVTCATEGNALEIVAPGCTLKLSAQKWSGAVNFEEQGTGIGATVKVDANSKTVTFKKSGFGCFVISGNEGSFNANLTLSGTYAG
jgi:hypothetical protein